MKNKKYRYSNGENNYLKRFYIFAGFFALILLIILGKYGWLMLVKHSTGSKDDISPLWERGAIVDRNNQLLAIEAKLGTVSLQKKTISNLNEAKELILDIELCKNLSQALAPILNMSANEIFNTIRTTPTDYVTIKKRVDKSSMDKLRSAKQGRIDEETAAAIEVLYNNDKDGKAKAASNALALAQQKQKLLKNVRLDVLPGRIYPEGRLASQLIGMVGDENKGQDGIEHEFNDDLSPKKDEDGKRIILTIDVKIQHILEQIAETTLKTNAAESIMLTAMNPQTGEILGSASLPHFDPNTYNQFPGTILRYQPALFTYEPGSVFKIFTVASLLDTDAITDNSTFVCNGHYNKVSPIITDLVSHGTVNAEKIIAYSCNVGVSIASERINSAAFYNKLYSFGFGNRIGSGSPSESSGIFHSVDTWDPRSKPTLAIGQGISVTMLQMLQAATALANNGVMVQPRVVLGIQDDKGNIKPYKTREPRQVINQGTAQSIIRDMSASTNNDGTAWRAAIGDIPMAVKTGTAQVSVNGVYSDTDFIASCMAIFPADNPTLILYVVIVNPQGQSYLGGQIATLPVKEAAESLVNYLGISRERNVHIDAVQFQEQPIQTPPHLEDVMPNLIGYSKQNLIPLLDQDSFYIKINGSGHVRQQVPAVGVQLIHGDSITLYLE